MASAKAIALVQTDDRNVNKLQDNIVSGLRPVISGPLAVTSLVQTLSLASGDNIINHGLGQTPIGYIVTRNNDAVTFITVSFSATTATLRTSGAVLCDILFF